MEPYSSLEGASPNVGDLSVGEKIAGEKIVREKIVGEKIAELYSEQ